MFGAEEVLFRRCADETVQKELPALVADFKDYFVRHGQVVYENPSPGNKAGGITTLEEKSLGCVQKGGSSPICGVAALWSAGAEPGSDRAPDPRQRSGIHHRSGGGGSAHGALHHWAGNALCRARPYVEDLHQHRSGPAQAPMDRLQRRYAGAGGLLG